MRDTKNQASPKSIVTLDRAQLVGLGFFAVLSGGLMFGLGYSAGKNRPVQTAVLEPSDKARTVLSRIDQKADLHDEIKQDVDLTFYKALVEKEEKQKAPKAEKVETARLDPVPPKVEAPKVDAIKKTKPDALAPVAAPPAEEAALTNVVVEDDPPEPRALPAAAKEPVKDATAKEVVKPAGAFTIQVSAFKTQPEAASYVKLLTAKGFNAHITPATVEGKGTWYRVRVGSFSSSAAATVYKDKLSRENLPAWIVKAD